MSNLTQAKREKMLSFLNELRNQLKDESTLRSIAEIETALSEKKYGLVWEKHREKASEMLEHNIPIFVEDVGRKITADENSPYNFLLEGDNLHSLKLLEKTHRGKIDVIYIDPPYNTGNKDFIYNDVFVDKTDGFSHSKWLSFMATRLELAHDLLSDEGVIFISIDDNEQAQLKLLCDEVFGEDNFIENAIYKKSSNGKGDKKGFANNHEYILCYQKTCNAKFYGLKPTEEYKNKFDKEDIYGKYKQDGILMKKGADSKREDSPTLYFPLYYNPKTGEVSLHQNNKFFLERYPYKADGTDGRWTWGKEKIEKEAYRLYASPNATIYIKDYYSNDKRMKIKSILDEKKYINNYATNELKEILGNNKFNNPKSSKLITDLLDISTHKNAIVLDFFAGSGTTGHAVVQLNKEDGGNRKYILCTNNENNICEEVTYQRLKNIQKDLPHNLKYFKTAFIKKQIDDEDSDESIAPQLLAHIKELIELEKHIELDNKTHVIVDDEDELDEVLNDIQKGASLFLTSGLFLTRSQKRIIDEKKLRLIEIPTYYYRNELRELGEV